MKDFSACLKRLLVFIALASVATKSFALFTDCSASLPMTVNMPSVTIPADLSAGQPIPGARASFSVAINCTIDLSNEWYMTSFSAAFSLVPGFTDVYTVPGMGAGVGFRMRDASGAIMKPISYNGTVNTFDMGGATRGANLLQGIVELVKTGTVSTGSFGFTTSFHVPSKEWANGGAQATSALAFNYTVLATVVPTCSVTTTAIGVTLPAVSRSAFGGPGATAGSTAFGIGLNCADNARPSITLTDAAKPFNTSSTLTLSSGSTASGIGVQILYQGQPMTFGAANYAYTSSNAPTVNTVALGTRSGATTVGFHARYIQTAPTVNPGSVNAVATFNMSYN